MDRWRTNYDDDANGIRWKMSSVSFHDFLGGRLMENDGSLTPSTTLVFKTGKKMLCILFFLAMRQKKLKGVDRSPCRITCFLVLFGMDAHDKCH